MTTDALVIEPAASIVRVPRVTIGMPVYNGESTLAPAIEALLSQTESDLDLIISDNASTDGTEAICRDFAAHDTRVRYYRQRTNVGSVANFGFVLESAVGEYFMWAAHDDLKSPDFVATCLRGFDSPDLVLLYPLVRVVSPDGEREWVEADDIDTTGEKRLAARVRRVFRGVRLRTSIYGLVRTKSLRAVLPLPRVYASDHATLVLLALQGQFRLVPEVLMTYRMRSQYSIKSSLELYRYYNRVMEPGSQHLWKYCSFLAGALVIGRRILQMEIAARDKIALLWQVLAGLAHMEVTPRVKAYGGRMGLCSYIDPRPWR